MHGLVNRAIQNFVRDIYGAEKWTEIAQAGDVALRDFESLNSYPDDLTAEIVDIACEKLAKPRVEFLDDLGTYLVSHRNCENIRRLLRFGGDTFPDFLMALDDLPERARLAMPDLGLPDLEMTETEPGQVLLSVIRPPAGFVQVFTGLLRAMADDYGALVLLDMDEYPDGAEVQTISITLLDLAHSEGRSFSLAGGV